MYAALQPRMTCLSIRPPARLLAVLALSLSACTDAPERPTRNPAPPHELGEQASPGASAKAVRMPEVTGRRLGVPRADNRVLRPVELPPSNGVATAERFRPGVVARAAPAAVAAPEPPAGTLACATVPGDCRSPALRGGSGLFGKPDAELLEPLRSGQLQSATKGTSGRTLAFKLTFESGAQGYYKPEQRLASASSRAEVAAYDLDRALGLGRVPPVTSRKLAWKPLEAAARNDARKRAIVVDRDGEVRGALIAWLSETLAPLEAPPGWENWLRIEPRTPADVNPFQPAAAYKRALADARKRRALQAPNTAAEADAPKVDSSQPARPDLPAELSDLVVFDYLTANSDRFESRDNLLTLGPQGPLIFLDNGAAFSASAAAAERPLLDARLAFVSKFRRSTIEALRGLDSEALRATMAADSLGPLLDEAAWRGFEARRAAVLEHVAQLEKRFGDAVYAW
jgi:Golgi casein kinase, C-terminal, Fam20